MSILIASLLMAVSGVVLYSAPPGSVARQIDWNLFGLDKGDWMAIHTTMSVVFVSAAVLHLLFNWRVLVHYVRSRAPKAPLRWQEMAVAVLVVAVICIGAVRSIPPFSVVHTAQSGIKKYWNEREFRGGQSSPSAEIQNASLPDFAARAGVSVSEMIEIFDQAGYHVDNPMMSVNDFARQYDVSTKTLFELLSKDAAPYRERKRIRSAGEVGREQR